MVEWDWADVLALGVMIQMDLHPWDLSRLIDALTGPWTDARVADARAEHHYIAAAVRRSYQHGERDGFRRGVQETFATARRVRSAHG